MTPYDAALVGSVVIVGFLTVARVIEVMGGKRPTDALTAAFSLAVSASIALIAARRGPRE